ncbi:MAG: hypothetical protein ACHQLA_01515 [Ignavibacteriales bacterium]
MNKILSILILTVFIYNTIGFLVVQPFLSNYYKSLGMQQADKNDEEELIELLVFQKEDILNQKINFIWIHSREFKYNGDMYDIVKKVENEFELILYCINDTKEKKLEEEFEKRVHQNSSENKQKPSTNNHSHNLVSEPFQSEQTGAALTTECNFSFRQTDNYRSLHLDIPSPPPRLV